MKKITPFLNIEKNCDTGGDCFPDVRYVFLHGGLGNNLNNINYSAKVRLADGTAMSLYTLNDNCSRVSGTSDELKHACGILDVDINGDKAPNAVAKDFFTFWVTTGGVVPLGTPADRTYSVDTCHSNGSSCAAWVLLKGNMDYLGKEVSW